MAGETILVVEDDGILATHLQDMLTRCGYIVPEPVATGEAALAVTEALLPELVLMDIYLAGPMNGVAAAQQIYTRFDIPVIYLTAFSTEALLHQAKITTPYGYLVKPVSERELLATLEMTLYRHRLDRRLKNSEERLALALWGADLGIWDWSICTNRVLYNPHWAEILGYRPEDISLDNDSWEERIHPEDRPAVLEAMNAHLEGHAPFFESEHRLRHQSGRWLWVLSKGKVTERDAQGQPLRVCGTHLDIGKQKRLEEELRQLAATDPLTGTFNRRSFLQSISQEINRAQRYERPLALIMIDIDHFKQINDTLGHERGDEALKDISARVRQRLRQTDVFARWGGEEFLILAVETTLQQAVTLAETLLTALRDASLAGIGSVTASFGVACYRSGETPDQWLKRVDDLMYQAKSEGRNRVCHAG